MTIVQCRKEETRNSNPGVLPWSRSRGKRFPPLICFDTQHEILFSCVWHGMKTTKKYDWPEHSPMSKKGVCEVTHSSANANGWLRAKIPLDQMKLVFLNSSGWAHTRSTGRGTDPELRFKFDYNGNNIARSCEFVGRIENKVSGRSRHKKEKMMRSCCNIKNTGFRCVNAQPTDEIPPYVSRARWQCTRDDDGHRIEWIVGHRLLCVQNIGEIKNLFHLWCNTVSRRTICEINPI